MGEKDYFLGGGALGEEDPSNEITLIRVNRSSEEGGKGKNAREKPAQRTFKPLKALATCSMSFTFHSPLQPFPSFLYLR